MVVVRIESYGHGGVGVGRVDGKVHFVEGAIPGDVVEVAVIREKPAWVRATTVRVVEASHERREPPCPHAGSCGGCDLQHAVVAAQRRWKREVVGDQLARVAGVETAVADVVTPGGDLHYRNRMDFSVRDGRPALHRRSSHDLVPIDRCLLLAPALEALFARLGDLGGATGVTLRAGVATGDLLAVVSGDIPAGSEAWGVPVCRPVPGGTDVVVGRDHLFEEVAGTRFRITASAFFQNSTAGAEALVDLVRGAVAGRGGTLVDLYAGGGLFAATVGGGFDEVVAVEASGPAAGDLRHNLAGTGARIHGGRVEDLDIGAAGTVVVDPPRVGLGRDGVRTLASIGPERIVYVSCEPATLARDVALAADHGYRLGTVTPVDLFPQTHHVEVVAVLDR